MIIPLCIGFQPSQVVQDFFHQQYHIYLSTFTLMWDILGRSWKWLKPHAWNKNANPTTKNQPKSYSNSEFWWLKTNTNKTHLKHVCCSMYLTLESYLSYIYISNIIYIYTLYIYIIYFYSSLPLSKRQSLPQFAPDRNSFPSTQWGGRWRIRNANRSTFRVKGPSPLTDGQVGR